MNPFDTGWVIEKSHINGIILFRQGLKLGSSVSRMPSGCVVWYRNWPRCGPRWSGLCCHSRHSTSGAGRLAAARKRKRHCDDESVHRYNVRTIGQCDVTIARGSHVDDVTIAKLLTFEIISGAAKNEQYGFRLSKTMWRFNYKWVVVFCNGEYHQRLNSHPWW